MAKVSKALVDKELRKEVFKILFGDPDVTEMTDETSGIVINKINDRQYGILLHDLNGELRYVRIGAIVAELREDMTAQELMESEIATYQAKQEAKAEKEKAKQEKIAKDKAERERKAKEQEEQSK